MPIKDLSEGKGKVNFAENQFSADSLPGVKVEPIGRPEDFLQIYTNVKKAQRIIDFKCNYLVKDGFFVASRNEQNKRKVEEFLRGINLIDMIRVWDKQARIYGNGYLEFTGDNLIPRDSRKMFVRVDEEGHGEIVAYVQEIGNAESDYPTFEPEEMLLLLNNPIDHLRGLSELLAIEETVNITDSLINALDATINRNAYRRNHWVVGSEDKPIPPESDKFQDVEEKIQGLLPGEDLVTTHEVDRKDMDSVDLSMDYKNFLEDNNNSLFMELGVSPDFWFGNVSGETIDRRLMIFEESEIMPRRSQIESIINQQLIPQLVNSTADDPVWFKFGDVNTERAFLEKKGLLVDVQTGTKTVNEARIEQGLDPIDGGDVPGGAQAVNANGSNTSTPVSSRDETSTGTIGENMTGSRS